MKIAVVGSRTFPQLKLVEWFIGDLPRGVTVVSGGAEGVDRLAIDHAKARGLETFEHLPDLTGCKEKFEFAKRYYDRNQAIVDDADLVIAFTEKEQGGTWDTIKRACKAGKPVKVIKPSLLFPGDAEEETENSKTDETLAPEEVLPHLTSRAANKGKGPFSLRRISLGSYAIRRSRYIEPVEWAQFTSDKDNNPEALAERIAPAFLEFFETHNNFGTLHAVTVAPRSIRNLDKPHVMQFVGARVAEACNVPFVQMFKPWEKSTRGRHAKHGEIEITGDVPPYIGKVVWVLDDVTTSNFTLRASVQALMALEIHSHGLAYVTIA